MKVHLFRPQKWVDSLETQGDKELVGTLKGFDEYVSIYSIYSYMELRKNDTIFEAFFFF